MNDDHIKKAQSEQNARIAGLYGDNLQKGGVGSGRHPLHDKLDKFLEKFPNNAASWNQATDEVRDLARTAKEYHNELDLDVASDDPKAHESHDFRVHKTPADWNTKGKKYIQDTVSKMSDATKNAFMERHSHWLDGKVEKSEDMDLQKANEIVDDYFEKGGKAAVMGEKRTFGGREYIKTADGWKFHGKGTGAKAQEHAKGTSDGGKVEKKDGNNDDTYAAYSRGDISAEEGQRQLRKDEIKEKQHHESKLPTTEFLNNKDKYSISFTVEQEAKGAAAARYVVNEENLSHSQLKALVKKHHKQSSLSSSGRRVGNIIVKNLDTKKNQNMDRSKFLDEPKNESDKTEEKKAVSKITQKKFDELTELIRDSKAKGENAYKLGYVEHREKAKEYKKKLDALCEVHDMSLFTNTKSYRSWLSPGPMKISDDHNHEAYSFNVKRGAEKNSSTFDIPTDQGIKDKKESRKKALKGIASGTTVYFSPGGYHFMVSFRKTEQGNTTVELSGRPSNAVGRNPLFKEYEIKGWNIENQMSEVGKYDLKAVRNLMNSFNGKPISKYV